MKWTRKDWAAVFGFLFALALAVYLAFLPDQLKDQETARTAKIVCIVLIVGSLISFGVQTYLGKKEEIEHTNSEKKWRVKQEEGQREVLRLQHEIKTNSDRTSGQIEQLTGALIRYAPSMDLKLADELKRLHKGYKYAVEHPHHFMKKPKVDPSVIFGGGGGGNVIESVEYDPVIEREKLSARLSAFLDKLEKERGA